MSFISAEKGCQNRLCSLKEQGRYLGQYAGNHHAKVVVDVKLNIITDRALCMK